MVFAKRGDTVVIVRLLAAASICFCLAPAAMAGPHEDGMAAYEAGDFAAALQHMRPLAEAGDARAQYQLGAMHGQGEGVTQSDAEWVAWLQRAADGGYAPAQTEIGLILVDGVHLPKNWPLAHMYFNLAVENGDPEAIAVNAWLRSQLTPEQEAEAARLKGAWLNEHGN